MLNRDRSRGVVVGSLGGVVAGRAIAVAIAVGVCLGPLAATDAGAVVRADSVEDYDISANVGGWGMMEFWALGEAPITRSQARLYGRVLGLDETQQELALEMQSIIAADYRRAWTLFREEMSDAQYTRMAGPDADWQKMQEDFEAGAEAFRETLDELRESFFDDMRLLLNDSQEANWERFERARRRVTSLSGQTTYPGEQFDLIEMVYALELSEAELAELRTTMEEYEIELDAALVARNEKAAQLKAQMEEFSDAQQALWRGEQGPDFDWQAAQESLDAMKPAVIKAALETRDAAARVRDVNERYIDRFAEELPAAAAETMKARITEALTSAAHVGGGMFGNASRATMAFALLEDVQTLDSMMNFQRRLMTTVGQGGASAAPRIGALTDEQRERIDEVREEYERRRERLFAEHADTLKPAEEEPLSIAYPGGTADLQPVDQSGNMPPRFSAQQQPDEDEQKFAAERAELNQWVIDELRAVLTMDQRAVLAQF